MTTFDTLWFWRGNRLNDAWYEIAKYTSDTYPHPYLLETPVRPDDPSLRGYTALDSDGRLVIHDLQRFPEAPPLWFVHAEAIVGIVEMSALSAYADERFAEGTVLSAREAKSLGVTGVGRVGALSWVRPTNVLQQVTVDEGWRRRKISTLLIGAADSLIIASGSDVFLTGGEFTTGDGEGLREAWAKSARVVERRGEVS